MDRRRVAIVIPALNEAGTVAAVISNVRPYGLPIVVDDGSSDGTSSVAESQGAEVVRLPVNRGYDGALDAGFARASELGCEVAITIDADGQHDPTVLDTFIHEFESKADLVLGVRDRRQRFTEHLFAWLTRMRWGLKDPLCGMKGYRMEVYRKLGHFDSYQSIGTELALFGVRSGYKVVQVPIPTRPRDGKPRFGRVFSANMRILRAIIKGLL